MVMELEEDRFGEDILMMKTSILSTKSSACQWLMPGQTLMEVNSLLPRLKLPGLMEDTLFSEKLLKELMWQKHSKPKELAQESQRNWPKLELAALKLYDDLLEGRFHYLFENYVKDMIKVNPE